MKHSPGQMKLPFQQVPSASQIKVGNCFQYNAIYYMRIAPVKTLLHSTTLYEVISRGDVLAVNLKTGIFTVLPASMPVTPLDTTFSIEQ